MQKITLQILLVLKDGNIRPVIIRMMKLLMQKNTWVKKIGKIQCGNNFVKAETITKLLTALDVEPKELFDFAQHKSLSILKEELTKAIQNDTVDIELMYKIYKSII